jgi:hypothetical protein
MQRTLLVLTTAAVALSPLAASAAPVKTTKRTVTFDYTGFTAVGTSGASLNYDGPCAAVDACWDFSTNKGEKTLEIKGSDASVGFQVWVDDDYEGTVASFCGAGKVTVSAKAAHAVSVRPLLSDCGGVPTSGTLTAVITGTK